MKQVVVFSILSFSIFIFSCNNAKNMAEARNESRLPTSNTELPPPPPPISDEPINESYDKITENAFLSTKVSPLSTFSIDVDRASYSNIRRFINQGNKPPKDAIRIEEMINYFPYDYPQPNGEHPFTVYSEVTSCPWNSQNLLLMIGLQGKKMDLGQLPPSNLVFLLDVSGSMNAPNKLPLLTAALSMLTDNLRKEDKVAIVVYAGSSGLVLPSTSDKSKIKNALDELSAGGSTAGGEGLMLAYKVAQENFLAKGNNRVILATDGDFNVGLSSDKAMEDLITKKRETGIFLTCLGFGNGNLKDSKMETLADKGNGNYAYIDNMQEARKVLVNEIGGTLFTIAKDVKLQVEFNPTKVQGYRLIGYENRMLNAEDFKDDKKDAGEMGAGHTVTAIYEIVPAGVQSDVMKPINDLKYQENKPKPENKTLNELADVHLRYKKPDGEKGIEFNQTVASASTPFEKSSENIRFASSVALWGMMLRDSEYKGKGNYDMLLSLVQNAQTFDPEGERAECINLIKTAKQLK